MSFNPSQLVIKPDVVDGPFGNVWFYSRGIIFESCEMYAKFRQALDDILTRTIDWENKLQPSTGSGESAIPRTPK